MTNKKVNLILLCATTNEQNKFTIGIKTNAGYDQPIMLKNDMHRFRVFTKDQCVVMGRHAWEAIGSKPLPKRLNVIISSQDLDINYPNVKVFKSFEQMFKELENEDFREYFFIGGAKLVESFHEKYLFDRIYLTVINGLAINTRLGNYETITLDLPLNKYKFLSRSKSLDWIASDPEYLYTTYVIKLIQTKKDLTW